MLQSSENSFNPKAGSPASNPNAYNPIKTVTAPVDQATIGRTLFIKGEISGSEALYIDGRIEGKINMPESRVTIGRNGKVDASIQAREVVVMGKVTGNIECSDRVDIRAEGSVHGDISTSRISVEDGAALKGGIQVRSEGKHKDSPAQNQSKLWRPRPARNWPEDSPIISRGTLARAPAVLWNLTRRIPTDVAGKVSRHHSWRDRPSWSKLQLYELLLLHRPEIQGRRIHAIAQPGGRRPILKHMSQMRVALGAANFGPHHAELRIPMLHQVAGLPGFVETRPARPGIEFGLGIEQRRAAAHAVIHSRLFRVPIPPGKRTLGARLAGHVILFVAKLFFPLGFALGNFLCRLFGHVGSLSMIYLAKS
jgi:cytoskeletal protein CcmA (bactofilin family)